MQYIDVIKAIQGATKDNGIGSETINDIKIQDAKTLLADGMLDSIGIDESGSTRNGASQKFVFSATKSSNKYNVVAFPDEDLFAGDIIFFRGEHWIVLETSLNNPVTKTGIVALCNLNLKFQNGTSDVIEKWAYLDHGVYSTTVSGDSQVQILAKQYNLYIPYDDDTKKIYVDKRIAVDKRYDSGGNQILETYSVTGFNRIERSFGDGSHLLCCELKSSTYSKQNDNLDMMICDYINPSSSDVVSPLRVDIIGNSKVRIGDSASYTVLYFDSDGKSCDTNKEFFMELVLIKLDGNYAPMSIFSTLKSSSGNISFSVPKDESLIGHILTLSIDSGVQGNKHQWIANKNIEVVS